MDTVTISRAEYEDLVDARDHEAAMRDIGRGGMETLTDGELDLYLASPSPLAFWRKRRGMTQAVLATAVGIAQPSLARAESGRSALTAGNLARAARVLRVRMEDLVADE